MARRTGAEARPLTLVAIGAGMIVSAIPVACLMASWRPGQELAVAVHDELWGRPGAWRLLRGVLAYVCIPAMLATAAVVILLALRRSRRSATLLAAAMVLGNISVPVGNLTVTASNGNVNKGTNVTLTIGGTSSFHAPNGTVNL